MRGTPWVKKCEERSVRKMCEEHSERKVCEGYSVGKMCEGYSRSDGSYGITPENI